MKKSHALISVMLIVAAVAVLPRDPALLRPATVAAGPPPLPQAPQEAAKAPTMVLTGNNTLLLNLSEIVAANLHVDAAGNRDGDQVSLTFRSGWTWNVDGADARALWARLANQAPPPEPTPAPNPDPQPFPAGESWALIRRRNVATAVLVYAELAQMIIGEWSEPTTQTNLYIFGADPKKPWTLVIDDQPKAIKPDDKGYHYVSIPPSDTPHRFALHQAIGPPP